MAKEGDISCKPGSHVLLLSNKLLHTLAAFNNNKHLLSHITTSVVLEFGSGLLVVLAQGFS